MNPQPISRVLKEPICFTFADVVRVHREARGWEPNDLGVFTKLSGQMIKYVEAHSRVPTIDVGARISRAFGVPFSQLIIEAERRLIGVSQQEVVILSEAKTEADKARFSENPVVPGRDPSLRSG